MTLREHRPRAARGDAQAFLLKAMRWEHDKCLEWPFCINQDGLPSIGVRGGKSGTTRSVRRLVCESAHGGAPQSGEVWDAIVTCRNTQCVAPAHLKWSTDSQQFKTDYVPGFGNVKGTKNGYAKLSAEEALCIRAEAGTYITIGKRYGVSAGTVWKIKSKLTWRHL